MQLILPIIAIGIAAAVSFLNHPQNSNTQNVLSTETTTEQEIKDPTPTPQKEILSTPTASPSPTATPTPPQKQSGDFIYPNSKNTGGENYESTDDPDVITNWYKEKIKGMGMNIKTFVTTKTNGNVLNKLAGATSERNFQVEIGRKEGEAVTKIKISY